MDTAFLHKINSQRLGAEQSNPITAFHLSVHMAHRFLALLILFLTGLVAWKSRRECGTGSFLAKLTLAWWVIICFQAVLGAATVWSNKAADIATAHVLLGTLALLTGTISSWAVLSRRGSSSVAADSLVYSPQRDISQSGTRAIKADSAAT
jgi:heme A synthase